MLFDDYLIIDWSAAGKPSPAKPSKDAIWVGHARSEDAVRIETTYYRTRRSAMGAITNLLLELTARNRRVLLGIDAAYAYPHGTNAALGGGGDNAWHTTWQLIAGLIEDDANNANNRYKVAAELNRRMGAPAGPFWGCPASSSGAFLVPKRGFSYPVITADRQVLAERRIVETRYRRMQPAWKLAYTGSVGSQTLTAIPYLHGLRFQHETLGLTSRVWPFETGFSTDPLGEIERTEPTPRPLILHAEIYPSLVSRPGTDPIPDREQVICLARHLRRLDRENRLGGLLDRPANLAPQELEMVLQEEGWVLGVR